MSDTVKPSSRDIPAGMRLNRPDDLGREAGFHLARLTWSAMDELRAAGIPFEEPCGTCAFRLGTFPNGCAATVADALDSAVSEDTDFLCHERPDLGPRICKGFEIWRKSHEVHA